MEDVKIFSNGIETNSSFYYLEVNKEVNRIATARVIFDYEDAPSIKTELEGMIHGAPIEIRSYDENGGQDIFKGVVVKYAIRKLKRGAPSVVIDCRDIAYKMTLEDKNAIFHEKTDEEVIKELAENHGVSFRQVLNPAEEKKELLQYQVSDWEFALNRAQSSGRCLVTDNGILRIIDPLNAKINPGFQPDVNEFEAEMDSRYQLPNVYSTFWNPDNQELEIVDAEDSNVAKDRKKEQGAIGKEEISSEKLASIGSHSGSLLRLSGSLDTNELKEWTTARVTQSHLSKIQARIKCEGTPEVQLGETINLGEIEDLEDRLSGQGFVSGIRHTIDMQGSETDIQIGLPIENDQGHTSSKNKHHLIPSVQGLHVGIVTKLDDAHERIQVRIPVFDNTLSAPEDVKFSGQEGIIWARLAAEYAGKGHGVTFRPEVDDEVVLGFLQGDPRQGIILGSLHSSDRLSTIQEAEKNPVKGIVTRSKMEISFNDDDQSVTIKSPGEKSITINDKEDTISILDNNNNHLMMDKKGMHISCSQLDIKCNGAMNVEAGTMNLKGNGAINLESSSIKIQGNGVVDVQGGFISIGKGAVKVGAQILDGLGQSSKIIPG